MLQTSLTKQAALEMQEALIAEYSKPEFQAKLRFVLEDTCSAEDRKRIDLELRELREAVGAKFGFAASPEGVAKSIALFTPQLRANPEIAHNCNKMNILLYPQLQDELSDEGGKLGKLPWQVRGCSALDGRALTSNRCSELTAKYEAAQKAERREGKPPPAVKKNFVQGSAGRQWTVTGGTARGILVREGEGLDSPACAARLASNSLVEELELLGDRLHYKMLSGEGPGSGWVSIVVRGATLLRQVPQEENPQGQ
mmetsp:Transcript_53944/g.152025  ORF Transcript_53944/g.152025 Transcript_53944/m.152025 type:complete len:255 (-) Transcript_53944:148-912(-)